MERITIKPIILKSLRIYRGIPIEVMASKLAIDKDKYELLEKQPVELSIDEANKIAKIFKRNWAVFLLHKPPEKANVDHDNRTNKLKQIGVSYKTYDALEEANHLLNFILSIVEKAKIK